MVLKYPLIFSEQIPIVEVVESFSKKEAIRFGWGVMKSHLWFFVAILFISGFIQVFPKIVSSLAGKEPPIILSLVLIVISFAVAIVKLIMDLGFIKIALKLHDNQSAEIKDLFGSAGLFWKYLGGVILYNLIVSGGVILLIIPGIIFATRFQFYSYLIIDQGLGPIDALKRSWTITKGQVINLLLLGSLIIILNLAGVLVLLVGLLATIPTTIMAQAYVYRKLQAGGSPDQIISTRRIGCLAALGLFLVILIPIGAAVAILAINPLELTRKARDAARLSDLTNLARLIEEARIQGKPLCGNQLLPCEGNSNQETQSWVKVELTGLQSVVPVDPANSSVYFYRYCSDGQDWEIENKLESEKMMEKAINDGGNQPGLYEVGSSLTVCP